MKKRILSIVLAICMMLTIVPITAFAEGNATTAPSVSAYATKEQLMDDTFAPDPSTGEAANYGKLVFGNKEVEEDHSFTYAPQEWYILGKDTGVSGDNTIIFSASPIARNQPFATDNSTYNYEAGTGYGDEAGSISVTRNHYGASRLRAALQAAYTTFFTTAEQGMMNDTTVKTKDIQLSGRRYTYTTTDKLYALAADDVDSLTIKAGSKDQTVLIISKYWSSEGGSWLRSPSLNKDASGKYTGNYVLRVFNDHTVSRSRASGSIPVHPAANLNLSSVLFASGAVAASSGTETSGTIAPGTAMTLRLDGSIQDIGLVTYNTRTGDIKATKGSTTGDVALVVQGNDGTNDWYYSKQIDSTETVTVNTSDIKKALGLSANIDLSVCKIWLETTDSTEKMIYAVNADKEIEKINTTYVTKEQLMNSFTPYSNGTAANIGKLVFGKESDGETPQEWYILGKDSGVSGDNTIIFAASSMVPKQKFESNSTKGKPFLSQYGVYESNPQSVYQNHYGASELRTNLKKMVNSSNTTYFTTSEKGLMNATTVTTKDTYNQVTYTTTDKLYAPAADGYGSSYKTIKAGSSNQTVLAVDSYWKNTGGSSWLRSPDDEQKKNALYAQSGDYVNSRIIDKTSAVRPVSNLNLSSVLFASGAGAASSGTATSGTIAPGTAMTLRLDGTGKNIGTVTYNTTTGDIKATKGSTAGNVALVVQGNDGTNDWYYSKQIEGTEILNVSDIEAESNTPASVDLSACKIWLETTDSTERIIYAVYATETTIRIIHSVAITDINAPLTNTALDTEAACATTGVSSTTPSVTWMPEHTTAGYNTGYTASVTLSAGTGYEFTDSTTATVNGNTATSVMKNDDGTLTVTYTFSATAKDTLLSITTPQPITVANGTSYEDMNLPETVAIVTEGRTVTSAPVVWDIDTPESGSYNPNVLTEQTVTLSGTVSCPDDIDDNRVSLTTTITITINAADTVEAPQANPTSGTYTSNQWVELSSATQGAEIYYTLDGTTPSRTNGIKYTGAISVTGTEAQAVQTTIKAIAVKDKMQDSSVQTFIYTIRIPDTTVPTGEIKIDTNKWTEFLNDITFGLFFKDTQTVTITASDNSGEAVTISYLLSDKVLTAAELDNATFTVYNNTFKINPDNKYVIYAKLTDTSGNVTYLSSDGIVMDSVIPVISGVENGKTYCEAQTVTVTEDYIASVTVNGTDVTLDANNQFTLSPAEGMQTIVVTDKAGNETSVTVTVNNVHTAGNDDGDCSTPVYCIYHPNTVVVEAKSHDFSGEWQKDGTYHWHICQNDGCTVAEPQTPHAGTDDGDCTTAVICECGYTITAANAEHTYEWQDDNGQYWKKCKFCGDETAKKNIPTITINGADAVCITQDYKFSFTLPEGATDAVYGYEFENKGDLGFPVIIENNEPHGVVSSEWYEPSENSFKVYAGAKTADGFEFFVSKTVEIQNEHAGGTATCTELAICDTCGEEYGELDSSNHHLENIPAKAATVTETGNKEYWRCKDCSKYFADENGETEIELNDTVTQKLPPEIIEGTGQSLTAGEKKELTFRSNAAFSDFIRAQLDGKTLDEKNYTVKEDSTVVTLKADYVGTLSAGEHTIGIVSTSGTATTTFTIDAKTAVDNDTKSPQTGDNSHMALWFALLFVSGFGIVVPTVYSKKKSSAK